jgi:hypothetical protein
LASSAKRSSSERTTASGELTLAIATSDHQVSFSRSAHGKSNKVVSILLVRSVETRDIQSNISLRGSASSTSDVRWRIRASRLTRFDGPAIGATVRRCAVWLGGSMRRKFEISCPLGWSAIWVPPSSELDE